MGWLGWVGSVGWFEGGSKLVSLGWFEGGLRVVGLVKLGWMVELLVGWWFEVRWMVV